MIAGLDVVQSTRVVGAAPTALLEIGAGPPLILLHGAIECGAAMWAPVLAGLATRHRVLAPDLPGLGESPPMGTIDADRFATWFAAVVAATGEERPVVVAHSLLGSLAARTAASWQGGVRHLVIYSVPAVGPYRMPLRLRYVGARFALRPTPRNAERFDRFALYDLDATRARDPEWFEAFTAYTLARASVRHVKRTMSRLITTQTKPIPDAELARIQVPVTLLWGRHDRMVPLSVGQAAATRHGWPLRVIDGAGHAPHIETPTAFVDALADIAPAVR